MPRSTLDTRSTLLLCNPIHGRARDGADEVAAAARDARSAPTARASAEATSRRSCCRAWPRAPAAGAWRRTCAARGQRPPRGRDRAARRRPIADRLPEPGLDDHLEKFQPYRSDFGFFDLPPARARIVIGHLDDPRPVAERLDQDLARPELILLEHQLLEQVGPRRAIAADEMSVMRVPVRIVTSREKKWTPRCRIVLSLSK